jgi:TonB family protein
MRGSGAILLLSIVLFSIGAPSQDKEEQVYELGPGITPPKVVHQVSPEHPAEGFRIAGAVLIGLVVSSQGAPKDVRVLRSLDKAVDQNAVDAVKQWRFEPAKKEGQPVAVRLSIEIRFHDM